MKTVLVIFSTLLFALSLAVQAATITVHDGDIFNYDTGVDVFFDATLSAPNPWVTVEDRLDPSESFDFVVTVPPDMPFPGMGALLSTKPNFSGKTLVSPSSSNFVFPGEQFTFPVDDRYGLEQWITLAIGDADSPGAVTFEMASYLSGFPNGDIPIGQPLSNPAGSGQSFTYYGSGSGTNGVTSVLGPSVWILFIGGLVLLLMIIRRSKQSSFTVAG